jgi:hypothetical protein
MLRELFQLKTFTNQLIANNYAGCSKMEPSQMNARRRLVAETEDIHVLLGARDDVGCNVPLVCIHLSGLSRQAKPFFPLVQRVFRPLAIRDIDTNPDVTDKR